MILHSQASSKTTAEMRNFNTVTMLTVSVYFMVAVLTSQATSSLSCDWPTNTNQQLKSYISAGTPTTITGVSNLTTCREQCMSQTTFICAAINYQQSTRNCQLLTENDKLATAEAATGWVSSVRPICAGIWLPWNFIRKGVHTNGAGKYTEVQMTNLQSCMTSCLRDPSGGDECRSFTASVSGTQCQPSNVRVDAGDEGIVNSSDWQYFNRPLWYSESSTSSTPAEVKEYNNITGYFLQIYLGQKVPVSGYLVAWQYYLDYRSDKTMCTNFAGIWRKVGDTSYKLISRTLLTPEDDEKKGVRFQFIQGKAVRVKKGDLVSVFAMSKGAGATCVSRVSGTNSGGNQVVALDKTNLSEGEEVQSSPTHSTRSTSLKAYLSEYLALKSVPQPYHTDTLTYRQLRLPSSLTTEDSVVVEGYRVTCSTDANLTNPIVCHKELIPVSSRDVRLTLSDVTIPYYAAIQIVRNFNGEEFLDDRQSPVSAPFCAGRKKDGNANFKEEGIAANNGGVGVTITIVEPLTNDSCAKEIKVNYSSYDSGYRAIDNPIFTLKLKQGTTFDLKVYVKSEFGEEILLWRSIHSTSTGAGTFTTSIAATMPQSTTKADVPTTSPGSIPRTPLPGAQPAEDSMPGTVGGVVAGVLVIILLVILAVIIYRRRFAAELRDTPNVGKFFKRPRTEYGEDQIAMVETGTSADSWQAEHSRKAPHLPTRPENGVAEGASGKAGQNMNPTSTVYENTETRIPLEDLHGLIEHETDICPDCPFRREFLSLSKQPLPCLDGRIPENVKRNRFKNITAFDFNRVKLVATAKHPLDYINASFIKDYYGNEKFIAAQGPNDHTLVDMWRMIHDTKARVIVMVTNLVETGKRKCTQYWPDQVSTSVSYDDITVTLAEELKYASYTVRKLKYTLNNQTRTVSHFHYTEWYDQDVPSTAGLLSFRSRVKQAAAESNAPVIVHCSAGVGRTGTYIALDNLMAEAHERQYVDVFACVNRLRGQRMHMVQTHEQYACVYEMIAEAVSCGTTTISCSQFAAQLKVWREVDRESKLSTISDQFKKMGRISDQIPEESFLLAKSEENMDKNRDLTSIPTNRNRVIICQPEADGTDYINASYCDGYQQKDGFIITQTPLSKTIPDYWRMILEQKPAIIIYLNDCQNLKQYWPVDQDSSISAGQITVTNVMSKPLEDGTDATETVLDCKASKAVHRVKLVEMKIGDKLPTSRQLVSLCQQAEKYATTVDSIVAQCSNGGRLSGIFVVAMNLYLRTRIEQEIDVVLEVKLAREKRPQIITDLTQFEALYNFIEYYLSEFNEYSNFADIR